MLTLPPLQREFKSERAAERYLEAEGFTLVADPRNSRYAYNSACGLIDADIRFNSRGIYIEYRA